MAKPVHWTEKSIDDYANWLSFDFITQIAKTMEAMLLKQAQFADRLNLTKGRVSQIFNNPGNLTLNNIIKYSRCLGVKVAIVTYNDNDPDNESGPVNADIFRICWEERGKPKDVFEIEEKKPFKIATTSDGLLNEEDIQDIDISKKSAVNETIYQGE